MTTTVAPPPGEEVSAAVARTASSRLGDGRSIGRRLAEWFAANRVFTAALALGVVLRLLVFIAYAPALSVHR